MAQGPGLLSQAVPGQRLNTSALTPPTGVSARRQAGGPTPAVARLGGKKAAASVGQPSVAVYFRGGLSPTGGGDCRNRVSLLAILTPPADPPPRAGVKHTAFHFTIAAAFGVASKSRSGGYLHTFIFQPSIAQQDTPIWRSGLAEVWRSAPNERGRNSLTSSDRHDSIIEPPKMNRLPTDTPVFQAPDALTRDAQARYAGAILHSPPAENRCHDYLGPACGSLNGL